ncbi:hypothetical protein [Streptomyces sp. NPDC050504]|uniref:hypothetical protein n=1 Tax=Streptomyces sp. NPDC050504 TaxID=3365618 RepID=UPI00378804DC
MAICFELAVNFGDNIEAARTAARTEHWPQALSAGRFRIPLHRPALSAKSPTQLWVWPVAVSYGAGFDGSIPRFDLTEPEVEELGRGLYDLLRHFDGYLAAMVGWEVQYRVDIDDLAAEWTEELADGSLTGLVLADHLRDRLTLGSTWVPFQPGYSWIPCP